MLIILEYINYLIKNKNLSKEINNKLIEFTIKICILFIIFIPLLGYTATIMRLPREMLVFIYITAAYLIEDKIFKNKELSKNSLVIYALLSMLTFIWIQGFIISIGNLEKTYISALKNNYLLEYITFLLTFIVSH